MASELAETLFWSWLLTVLIESMAAFLWGLRGRRNYLLLFLVNTFTNPLAVLLSFALYRYTPLLLLTAQIIVEAAVFLSEGLIFRRNIDFGKCGDRCSNPWYLSLAVNLVSFASGLLLSLLI